MKQNEWTELPLFPLNTVLFPGMVLPLHVFEDRYKLMVEHCLEEDRPFGVVLIREGQEVGPSLPYQVGTTTVIAAVTRMDDGRMNIVTIGSERFRLLSVRHDQPYLVGVARPWPLVGASTERAQDQVGPLRALFHVYLRLLAQAQGHEIRVEEVPDEPRTLALLIAISMQLPMLEKQRLLRQPTVPHMLLAERALLRKEHLLLDHIVQTQTKQWEGGSSGYLARN